MGRERKSHEREHGGSGEDGDDWVERFGPLKNSREDAEGETGSERLGPSDWEAS